MNLHSFDTLRRCHVCRTEHYAVNWRTLPLVETIQHRGHDAGAVEVRACPCGARLHVWRDDVSEKIGGLDELLSLLNSDDSVLPWATAWSGTGEEPLARAWRCEVSAVVLVRFLVWANPSAALEAVSALRVACGIVEPVAYRKSDRSRDASEWMRGNMPDYDDGYGDDSASLTDAQRMYLADIVRAEFDPPTLSTCLRIYRERKGSRAA